MESKKLKLRKETVRRLSAEELSQVDGGARTDVTRWVMLATALSDAVLV